MQTTDTRRRLPGLVVVALLMSSTLCAEQSAPSEPSPGAEIVRVRIGFSSGMCQGYCDSSTTVEPGWKRTVSRSLSDKKHYPEMKSEWRITREDWEDLKRFLDAKVLAVFTGRIGCPGCADQAVQWAAVEFSDGAKKSVSFNRGEAPPEIAALFSKIQSISAEPPPKPKGKSASGSPQS
jgi:hypothetical protein